MKKILVIVLMVMVINCIAAVRNQSKEIQKGISLFEQGKFKQSEKILKSEFNKNNKNDSLAFVIGKVMLSEQKSKKAIAFFTKATLLDSKQPDYFLWLGKAYLAEINKVSLFSKGSVSSKAKDSFKKSIELDPNQLEARFYLGMYYYNAPFFVGGDKDKGLEQAKEIFKRDKKMGYKIKAKYYTIDKEYDNAINMYKEIIKLDEKSNDSYASIGSIYQIQEKYNEAFNNFEIAIKLNPNDYSSIYQIGKTSVLSGQRLEKGIFYLKKYLENTPKAGLPPLDAAHWRLGMVYKWQNKIEEARSEFKIAIKMNSEYDTYQDSLDDLD